MKIKTFNLQYPDNGFKPSPIEELVTTFDEEVNRFMKDKDVISVNSHINGLVGGFQYFVTVVYK